MDKILNKNITMEISKYNYKNKIYVFFYNIPLKKAKYLLKDAIPEYFSNYKLN